MEPYRSFDEILAARLESVAKSLRPATPGELLQIARRNLCGRSELPSPPPATMKRLSYSAGALVVAVIFALSACERKTVQTEAPPTPEVLVTQVVKGDVPIVREWVGSLDGSENADIQARVAGYLQKKDYQEGGYVKQGDLLFEIDPRPFVAALDEAKSKLGQQKAVQLATEADFARAQELFDKKVISVQEYENKRQSNLANVAKTAALEAAVETAKLNLGFTKITAPVDGIAGVAKAQIGDLVGPRGNDLLDHSVSN